MDANTIIIGALAILVCVLILMLWRQRQRNHQLERLVMHTNDKLEHLQVHFGRFTPPEVIEHLTDVDGTYTPNHREVTVLFADLKGFTRMCEEMDPEVVVPILNGYFRAMSEALAAHHGQVTELLGDGMLALFGALRSNPWQVQDAVKGALAMREALKDYNDELRSKNLPALAFGIGLHHGNVLAGVMGNMELSKFGVVGDTINVAARVEALTRIHHVDLLITEEVRAALDGRYKVRKMPAVPVKGKEEPIVTYAVDGMVEASATVGH